MRILNNQGINQPSEQLNCAFTFMQHIILILHLQKLFKE